MSKNLLATLLVITLSAAAAHAGADLPTWTSPTAGGVTVPAGDLFSTRGTMVSATLVLRNTVSNAQSVMTFSASALRTAGHLSVADGAYGSNMIVETATFTMLYPGGLVKQVLRPIAALPQAQRPVSFVWDATQLTASQVQQMTPSPNWVTNNSMFEITVSPTGIVLASQKCNYIIHALVNGDI